VLVPSHQTENVGSAEPTEEIRRDETAHDLLELAGVEPEPGSAQPAQLMPPPEVVSPHQRPHIMEFERGLSSPLENNDLRLELTLSLPQPDPHLGGNKLEQLTGPESFSTTLSPVTSCPTSRGRA